jgi:hypothetical protein
LKILGVSLTITLLMLVGPLVTPIQPLDSYGNLCWENERIRLDNFAIQLLKQPSSNRGFILVAAGRTSCTNEAKYRGARAKDWVVKRGVAAHRVVVKDAGYQENVTTKLWLVPPGVGEPYLESQFKKTEVSIHNCVDKVFARVLCLDKK